MFLEGEVNWALVFGVVAAICVVAAITGLFAAARWALAYRNATAQLEHALMSHEGSARRLREVLDAIPVALVETDLGGKFIFANRAAHQLLGRRDAELLGLRFHSATWGITYPDGRPVPPDLLPSARALRGQTVKGFQHIMANPSSRRKMLVSVTAMPIVGPVGEVIGSTAAIVETDSLIQPEPAPAPEPVAAPVDPGLTRRVFDAASSALVVLDADGRVREANRTALERHGLDAGAVEGLDFADLFLALDERTEGRMALNAARAADPGAAAPIAAASGLTWRILALPGEDGALLLAGERTPEPLPEIPAEDTTDDPTEALRAELEQARARLTALEDRAAEDRAELTAARRLENVGRLTGGVAHDFSALLGVMTSALDMLLKQADQPDRVRRLGGAALNAGRRGEALTRRLAAFSQGEDAVMNRLDLSVLLKSMEPTLRHMAGEDVDLMIEAPDRPMEAVIDPAAFDGAVRALLDNAVQALEGRGSVAVRLDETPEGQWRLSVRDNGPGMDSDVLARASEPFFTTRDGATGLGLSQAYAFARQSGGRLSMDSAPGEGTEAALILPPAPEIAAETAPAAPEAEAAES
ncbi:PAS domain-containing protein [Brevundimonas sp. BAL450]|uniref:PAS domain-containing sensor histidine kinase n=2 Tax=Caulobacteraceae TaxID=76892 RepID=UPI0018CAF413|nr:MULTISPECIES: ATP-binding protein [Brevundimonas]MBG7616119.1 PAS domain-containing protein [Brevundimonas sp. BAL450]